MKIFVYIYIYIYIYIYKQGQLTLEEAYLEFFAVFMNFHLFVPQFLSELWLGDSSLTL